MSTAAPSNRKWKIALVAVLATAPLLGALGGAWATQTFPDVPPSNIFYDEIEWGAANGIINGYTNGKFGPNDKVNRGQAAAFLSHYNDAIHLVSTTTNPSNAADWYLDALCPVGERALGGFGTINYANIFIADTYITGAGRSFRMHFETEGGVVLDPSTATVTAICAPDSVANPASATDMSPAVDLGD